MKECLFQLLIKIINNMASNFIEINNFNSGSADGDYMGMAGSWGIGTKNIDSYTFPGLIKPTFALTKNSGAIVDDLVLWGFPGSDGATYLGGDAGKVYKRATDGTWTEDNDLTTRVCGMYEYNGYFYVATSDKLKRVAIGTGMVSLADWQTWTNDEIDTSWHPMIYGANGSLIIGAGQYISIVDSSGVWNAQALDLEPNWKIRCLANFNDNIIIGAYSTVWDESAIYIWDGHSDTWINKVICPEDTINAMISNGREVIVQAGGYGNIYQFVGNDFIKIKQVPNLKENASVATYPGAINFLDGNKLIGISNNSNNLCYQGVYNLSRRNNNYPINFGLNYTLSPGNTSGVSIGSITINGTGVYIGWKDTTGSTTYGVDAFPYTSYSTGVYETTVIGSNTANENGRLYKSVTINMKPLPASCSVVLYYKKNGGSWLPASSQETISTTGATRYKFTKAFPLEAQTIQFRLVLTPSGTTYPEINSLLIEHE